MIIMTVFNAFLSDAAHTVSQKKNALDSSTVQNSQKKKKSKQTVHRNNLQLTSFYQILHQKVYDMMHKEMRAKRVESVV